MMTAHQFLPRRLRYAAMICHVSCKKALKSARGARKFIAMVQFGIVIISASPLAAGVVVMVAGEEPPPGGVCASRGGVAVGRGVGGMANVAEIPCRLAWRAMPAQLHSQS